MKKAKYFIYRLLELVIVLLVCLGLLTVGAIEFAPYE